VKEKITKMTINKILDGIYKDPEHGMEKAMDFADTISLGNFATPRRLIREMAMDPEGVYHPLVRRITEEYDPHVVRTIVTNFFVQATLTAWPKQEKARKKYQCNIPWAILMDPTSACNLQCKGCWAAEYGNKLNLTLEELDSIIEQGKELGVYMYLFSGGEPLVRKNDIITLCERHPDCMFLAFTNSTLIDEKFANDMLRVGNFIPAISLEGNEHATDGRRGDGVFQRVMKSIGLLREKGLPFGISCCYTSQNFDSITSEEYYDFLIEQGALFVWFFHYMPVGNSAVPELLPTPEQREETMRRIRKYRVEKPLFAIDFQNDGQYAGGCIAGGRRYLHINSNGDVEPCAFIHYSDSNIREKTLLECLQSPLFMGYHDNQPFNDNLLKPCPMLENPQYIRSMVEASNSKSTDMESPENVQHLYEKCEPYAENWDETGNRLWDEIQEEKKVKAAR
jgi:MoaA/NifB/PqqE/SkfB family radical SAM enzyme